LALYWSVGKSCHRQADGPNRTSLARNARTGGQRARKKNSSTNLGAEQMPIADKVAAANQLNEFERHHRYGGFS